MKVQSEGRSYYSLGMPETNLEIIDNILRTFSKGSPPTVAPCGISSFFIASSRRGIGGDLVPKLRKHLLELVIEKEFSKYIFCIRRPLEVGDCTCILDFHAFFYKMNRCPGG
jgi:hypothetical protein